MIYLSHFINHLFLYICLDSYLLWRRRRRLLVLIIIPLTNVYKICLNWQRGGCPTEIQVRWNVAPHRLPLMMRLQNQPHYLCTRREGGHSLLLSFQLVSSIPSMIFSYDGSLINGEIWRSITSSSFNCDLAVGIYVCDVAEAASTSRRAVSFFLSIWDIFCLLSYVYFTFKWVLKLHKFCKSFCSVQLRASKIPESDFTTLSNGLKLVH